MKEGEREREKDRGREIGKEEGSDKGREKLHCEKHTNWLPPSSSLRGQGWNLQTRCIPLTGN